jgi:ABC-type multidrug transport system fused ATPase/permease subunit
MAIGLFFAALSGLGLPAWLVLLAQALDKFNNLAKLASIGGSGLQDALEQELFNLVIAFVVVGCVELVTGAIYVSTWTYTGEQQALRIKEKFVRASMKHDAEWFDTHDREEMVRRVASCFGLRIGIISSRLD